jgi:IS30 family transposase
VKYKPRRKSIAPKADPQKKTGHTYSCFLKYTNTHPGIHVTEMDTVVGRPGGKVLMTMLLRNTSLLLIFLIDNKETQSAVSALDSIQEKIGIENFRHMFPLLLGDNGPEFSNPSRFEADAQGEIRSKMFYCEPYQSNQKSRLEKTHEYIRYILPKGTGFDDLVESDIRNIMNHINSTARPGLNGKCPYDLALAEFGQPLLDALGVERIPADDVCLTANLIHGNIK